jgi:hypothetical protein
MALVREIKPITKDRESLHEETACCWSIVKADDGTKYLQLDTYGSKKRKFPGKISQAIQFDERAARQLRNLVDAVFPPK